ncbi:MAG: tyrosine-type recombinase/integrase [Pseudomonadota bacterium]|nr:tyrosine-type recombinase/integrase [Pseudomonadota bacterium]
MLADISIRRAKSEAKPYKLADGGGLYLEVFPNGSKLWRLKYRRIDGKETRISLGAYPEVPAPKARQKRDEIKLRRKEHGIDPAVERRLERLKAKHAAADSFEAVAREWHKKQKPKWRDTHSDKIIRWLEADIFPWMGARPTKEIAAQELLAVLRRVEGRGAVEKAHRARNICSQIFRYAVATGRAETDPASALRGALAPVKTTHHASLIEPTAVGALLRAIDGYNGTLVSRCALQLAPLVFVRPGELRQAEWAEIDLDGSEWRIPGEKMKMGDPHIVPLSQQALAVLREIHPLTGKGRYVFPGERSRARPMSENTVNAALRRLGYTTDQMTGHGFRSMASTLLHERNWNHQVIERQLAHADRNSVSAAYNYAEHLPERRRMMQEWADYLDVLQRGSKVSAVTFGKVA